MLGFYYQWVKTAFIPAVNWARLIAGFLAIFLPITAFRPLRESMPELNRILDAIPDWLTLPLVVFLLFFGTRLLLAPYWIYAKVKSDLDQLKAAADDKARRQRSASELAEVLKEIEALKRRCFVTNEDMERLEQHAKDLGTKAQEIIRSSLGEASASTFDTETGAPGIDIHRDKFQSVRHWKAYSWLHHRAYRVAEAMRDLTR